MPIAAVERLDDHLSVTWTGGSHSTFHHLWLRDNCLCPACRHQSVPERLVDTLSIPDDVAPASAELADGSLVIVWPDSHRSVFTEEWLTAYTYDHGPLPPEDRRELWPADSDDNPPEVEYDAIMGSDVDLLTWLREIDRFGVTMVRHAPTIPGTVVGVAERIAFLRNSNFGLLWDVISKPDPDSIAYTAHGLAPHTDLTGREMLPGVQFLHCLVFEAVGGDSMLVDGFACAAELAATDPASYDVLVNTPLRFRYRDGASTDITARVPMIRLDPAGRVCEVRYSNSLLAPLDVPSERMTETYRAVRAFGRMLQSGRFERRLRLRPGDVMCFDNYRLLHGRTEFDPNSGPRHLQGCYVDRDDFLSRIRTLESSLTPVR